VTAPSAAARASTTARSGGPARPGGVLDELRDLLAVALVVERDETDAREAVVDLVRRTPPRRAVEPVDEPDPVPLRARRADRGRPPVGCAGQQVGLRLVEVGGSVGEIRLGVLVVVTDQDRAAVPDVVQVRPVTAAVVEVPDAVGGAAGVGPAAGGADRGERRPPSAQRARDG